jgi:hypothetical protein
MKTLRDYINLIEDAQAPVQAPADPNKLLVFINFASGQGNKQYDLTSIMQKNGWVGTPAQVINQAEKWLSDFLRQRGDQWTGANWSYKGQLLRASQVGDAGAADEWADEIKNSFKK